MSSVSAEQGDGMEHTSSSLPPHTSSSSPSLDSPSSIRRARNLSSLFWSISLLFFCLRNSSASSGEKKNVSSESEGISDQPPGETGTDRVALVEPDQTGSTSINSRASYLENEKHKDVCKRRKQRERCVDF